MAHVVAKHTMLFPTVLAERFVEMEFYFRPIVVSVTMETLSLTMAAQKIVRCKITTNAQILGLCLLLSVFMQESLSI
jgi:hypothetical protein